ncbi:MAG: hypothetical protein ACQKBV_07820, partial [Puniceicoccales bacterium]
RVAYIPGERRDHYLPETEFRKLIANFIDEQLRPQLEVGLDAIRHLKDLANEGPEDAREHYQSRIEKLGRLHQIAGMVTPAISKLVNF